MHTGMNYASDVSTPDKSLPADQPDRLKSRSQKPASPATTAFTSIDFS